MSFDGKNQVTLKNPEDITAQAPKYTIPGTPGAASCTSLTVTGATLLNGTVGLGDASGDNISVNGTIVTDTLVGTTHKMEFGDAATYVNSSVDGQLDIDADVKVQITAPTTAVSAALAVAGVATFAVGQQSTVQAVTATVDGLTTGIIPDGALNVAVTSSVNTKLVTLPTPTPGSRIKIFCGANGYKLQSTSPTTVAINGGSGASASLAVAANDILDGYCTSATTWVFTKTGATGTQAAAGAAA